LLVYTHREKYFWLSQELKTINMLQENCPEVMVPHKKIIKDLSVMAFREWKILSVSSTTRSSLLIIAVVFS